MSEKKISINLSIEKNDLQFLEKQRKKIGFESVQQLIRILIKKSISKNNFKI